MSSDDVVTHEPEDSGTSATGATAGEQPSPAGSPQERAARRGRQTARDMLLSMLVVGGVVLLLVLPWDRTDPDTVKTVDVAPTVQIARDELAWPVLGPTGLSSDWRATSARLEAASDGEAVVHLGYLSPAGQYVGLEQSATRETAFVREQTIGGSPAGTEVVAGTTWQRYESQERRSLVRTTADGITYVVTGVGPWEDVVAFASSLRAG